MVAVISWIVAPELISHWQTITKAPAEARAVEQSVYYRNCDEARAAGAAPMYRGSPGYREGMDGDSDGIACEPY